MRVSLIGCGNMGSALILGMVQTGFIQSCCVYNRSEQKALDLASQLPECRVAPHASECAQNCDVLILAVKPYGILPLLEEIKDSIAQSNPLIISVAAGVDLDAMQAAAPQARLIRLMPNTPVRIGQGASGFVCGRHVQEKDAELCCQLMAKTGLCLPLQKESDIHTVIALAGSAVAYFFELLDAMAKFGPTQGMPEEIALQLATQSMLGAAALQQATGQSPLALRNAVTSPNGTTLAALRKLNSLGVKESWQAVMQAAIERSQEMEAKRKAELKA